MSDPWSMFVEALRPVAWIGGLLYALQVLVWGFRCPSCGREDGRDD